MTQSHSYEGTPCEAFNAAMGVIGKPWNGAIIQALRVGQSRFVDVKARVGGISDAVLTQRLSELQNCQLVCRIPAGPTSPRYLYQLTEKGRALLGPLDELTRWSEQWVFAASTTTAPSE